MTEHEQAKRDQLQRKMLEDLARSYDVLIEAVMGTGAKRFGRLSLDDDEWTFMGPALVLRAAHTMAGLKQLLTAGVRLDGWLLARSLYETVVTFAWVAIDPPTNLAIWKARSARSMMRAKRGADARAGEGLLGDEQMTSLFTEYFLDMTEDVTSDPNVLRMAVEADSAWAEVTTSPSPPHLWDSFTEGHEAAIGGLWGTFEGMYQLIYRGGSSAGHSDYWLTREYFTRPEDGELHVLFGEPERALTMTAFGAWEIPFMAAFDLFARMLGLSIRFYLWPNAATIVRTQLMTEMEWLRSCAELGFADEQEAEAALAGLEKAVEASAVLEAKLHQAKTEADG